MRTMSAFYALALAGAVLQPVPARALPGKAPGVRWEGAAEPGASRVILRNLDARPARAALGATTVALEGGGVAELPAARLETDRIQLRSDAHLLVLQAPDGFDAASLAVDGSDPRQVAPAGRPGLRRGPDWTQSLIANPARVRHGATGTARIASDYAGAEVEVAVEFIAPHTAVRLRQLDAAGNEVAFLTASASMPLRWRAVLGPVGGVARIEMQTLSGEARGTAAAVADGVPAERSALVAALAGGGNARFDPKTNWEKSPPLYYFVTGGPPSTCGALRVSRNYGPYTTTPGWLCTDANGNATKGPWTFGNQNGSEDGTGYILWPDGTSTNSDRHIWDKDAPSAAVGSPAGAPPGSFYGTASDPVYNAGFGSSWGSYCKAAHFRNTTTGKYWCPGAGGYTGWSSCSAALSSYNCTLSYNYGNPSLNVAWSANQVPPGYTHFSGECYEWKVEVYQASTSRSDYKGTATRTFCVP